MSNLRHARCAILRFAIGFSVGLLACLGNTQAGEFGAPPYETFEHEYKMASAAPFGETRDAPYRLSEPFGLETSALVVGGIQNKWNAVAEKLPRERETLMRCRTDANACPPGAKKFIAIVDKALTRDGLARIGEINRAINLAIRPIDDMIQYGVPDLWATPLMTFASGAGDCEDYAIAKYVALQEIGIAADNLRLVVVHDRTTNEDHAVAAVRYEGRWLILDNRTLIMAQDVAIAAFSPLFVIDREGVKRMMPSASKPQDPKTGVTPAAIDSQVSSGWQSTPLLL